MARLRKSRLGLAGSDVGRIRSKGHSRHGRRQRNLNFEQLETRHMLAGCLGDQEIPPWPPQQATGYDGAAVAGGIEGALAHTPAEGESTSESMGLITTDGSMLVDQATGRPWFFAGANNYYVGVDELDPQVVDEVMADMKAMGLNALRLWAFNDDQSKMWSRLQGPGAGDFIEDHFRRLDYAIGKAGDNGIRVILVLTNYWNDYGGMEQYVRWAGDDTPTAEEFYTNDQAQALYKSFVSHVANRVNTVTCRAYKHDPTILLWQLANEPRNRSDPDVSDGSPMSDWVVKTAAHLKDTIGVRQLAAVGMEGFYDQGNAGKGGSNWMDDEGTDFVSQHAVEQIDVAGFHLYPDAAHWNMSHAQAVRWIGAHARDARRDSSLGKPVVMDEFGWSMPLATLEQRDEYYRQYLGTAYRELVNGVNFWRIVDDKRNDTGSGDPMCDLPPDQRVSVGRDSDGLSVCYPGDASTVSVLRRHAQKIGLLDATGVHQWAAFERDEDEAFVLEGTEYLDGELQRVHEPPGAASVDGVLKLPVAFTDGGQDLLVGVPMTDLLTQTRGVDVSDFGYVSLVARLRVHGQLLGPGDAGLFVKIFTQTGPAYTWSDGAETRANQAEKWYDLVWGVGGVGDLKDLRTLGVKIRSGRAFAGDVYVEFLGGDLFSDWQNGVKREDVDNDRTVVPRDVLIVINKLNSDGSGPVPFVAPGDPRPQFFYDTNGDNYVAPMDALVVINYINAQPLVQGPSISITNLPAFGVGGSMRGQVARVNFSEYRVAAYIQIEGAGWWTKPTFASPTVRIASDGTFVANVTTGGIDHLATIFCAALVPAGVTPPPAAGAGRVPADPDSVAIDCQERYGRQIEFAGYTWAVKESPLPVGPGDNRFSAGPNDVFVDQDGLHLTVNYRDGYWRSSEVILLDHLGYGTYSFQTQSRLDKLDPNVTLGAFTWDAFGDDQSGASRNREIDLEDSRWGNPVDPTNAQMVVQPFYIPGNLRRYTIPNLDANPALTRFFTWRPCRVDFVALKGRHTPSDFAPEDVIDQFVYYENPSLNHFVPEKGRESFRFNLWINSERQPKNGESVEVVITDFSFAPLAAP